MIAMITSFLCRDTEDLFKGKKVARFERIERAAIKKLLLLNSVDKLVDLMIPAGNQLESLKGNYQGSYSIRINQQWRLCFRWIQNNACDVEIVDYH